MVAFMQRLAKKNQDQKHGVLAKGEIGLRVAVDHFLPHLEHLLMKRKSREKVNSLFLQGLSAPSFRKNIFQPL